jgi:hypothetical protein
MELRAHVKKMKMEVEAKASTSGEVLERTAGYNMAAERPQGGYN